MSESEASVAPTGDSDSAIVVRGLTRRFGAVTAVDNISFEVPRGSFFGFLGPNGAGKSTTVRMLSGLLAPDAGQAWIDGHSILEQPVEVKRRIGVIPDELALFSRLSILEHLTMIGGIYGLSAAEVGARSQDLLKVLDLWESRRKQVADCSHGMKKKLALALALIHNPRILFLDEPFEGIDPIAGKYIRDLLQRLARRGVTVFLTSHILEIIERLADRVAIIVDGRIALETTLAEVTGAGRTLEEVFIEVAGRPTEHLPEMSWLG